MDDHAGFLCTGCYDIHLSLNTSENEDAHYTACIVNSYYIVVGSIPSQMLDAQASANKPQS